MRAIVLAVVACGCSEYARVAMHSAPAEIDLAAPPFGAHDDPGTDPGSHYLSVWMTPYLIGGSGRHYTANGSAETGIELRFEHATNQLADERAWAITAGMGIVQWTPSTVDTGPIYAEINHRTLGAVIPIDVGIGPAFYPSGAAAGGQLTARFAAIGMARVRAMSSGFEIFAGFELPVPFFFGWSR